jgi:hypothetical protein
LIHIQIINSVKRMSKPLGIVDLLFLIVI